MKAGTTEFVFYRFYRLFLQLLIIKKNMEFTFKRKNKEEDELPLADD
jgi:hypothetical protein